MAHHRPFVLYTVFNDNKAKDRALFYLQEETRPNFPDEVPESEAELVELFEFLSYPHQVEAENNSLTLWFGDPYREEDLHEDIGPMMEGLSILGAKQVLVYWEYEDEACYEQYVNGNKELIWSVYGLESPEDEARYNKILPPKLKQDLKQLGDPVASIRRISEFLSEKQ